MEQYCSQSVANAGVSDIYRPEPAITKLIFSQG
jgi:hypothetical protein